MKNIHKEKPYVVNHFLNENLKKWTRYRLNEQAYQGENQVGRGKLAKIASQRNNSWVNKKLKNNQNKSKYGCFKFKI